MTTKNDYCFSKIRHQFVGKPIVDNDHPYSNLNLNQYHNSPILIPVQSHGKLYNSTISHNYEEKGNSQSMKKLNLVDLSYKMSHSLTLDEVEAGSKKRWKKNDSSDIRNSTLSLHIEAYENSINAFASDSFGDNMDRLKNEKWETIKKCKDINYFFNAATMVIKELQNPFEFPRQANDDHVGDPQLVQFRAGQRLLNPNGRGSYDKYTPRQKAECVIWFIETRSPTEVQRRFRTEYGIHASAPDQRNIKRWFEQFEQSGSVLRKERVAQRPIRTEANIEDVLLFFSGYQHSSLRRAENELGVSKSSIQRILNDQKWHPYVMQMVQELEPNDWLLRVAFAEQHLAFLAAQRDHLERIWWSDEAIFHVNGAVNKHNCRYWSPTNPIFHGQEPLHSPKVSVWAAINANGVLGPYFFPANVSGESYVHMLQEFFIPEMQNRPYFDDILFQHDGAPAHFALETRRLLNEVFRERWIGRASPNLNWPPRTPDLTPLDFFLWGYIKSIVYAVEIRDLEHLKERIIDAFIDLDPAMVRRACLRGVERRLRKCLAVNGRSVELPDPPQARPQLQQAVPAPQIPQPNRRRRASPAGNVAPPAKRRRGRPSNPPSSDVPVPESGIEANVAPLARNIAPTPEPELETSVDPTYRNIASAPEPEPEANFASDIPQHPPRQRNLCSIS